MAEERRAANPVVEQQQRQYDTLANDQNGESSTAIITAAAETVAILPQPIQVVTINENREFVVMEENLHSILLSPEVCDRPVAVISIAGPFRKGKSFMLNFFVRYLSHQDSDTTDWLGDMESPLQGFKWKHGADRETTGMWMWNKPFIRIHPKTKEEVAVLLVDTQGTFDNKTTYEENAKIFALDSLLSSLQVYNIQQHISEDVLQHMQLFTSFGRMVYDAEPSDRTKPFQTLQFLVRDWVNQNEFAYGHKGGAQYLASVLESRSGADELQSVREDIKSCFKEINCYLMPHPGHEVSENESGTFDGNLKLIRAKFIEQLRDFVPRLLASDNLVPKTVMGEEVTGEGLCNYFKTFVSMFGQGRLPDVKNVFEATAMVNYTNVKEAIFREYQKKLIKKAGPSRPYIDEGDLLKFHTEIMEQALSTYDSTKKLHSTRLEAQFLAELQIQISNEFDSVAEANRNKQLLVTLRTPIVLAGTSFVSHTLCTFLSIIGLSSFAALFSYVTWFCMLALILWAYCQYTGVFPEFSVEADKWCRSIFDLVQHVCLLYFVSHGPSLSFPSSQHKKTD